MTQLYVLGPAEIRNSEGELEHSFLAGPKRLALLTYLLLNRPRGFHRRDSLLLLFWPYQDQKSARNSLSNMLYHIRKTLGKEAIENRGSEEITINVETFWSDALAFEQAIEEKKPAEALKLYRSDLLKGFHVSDISPEFDQWLEQERNRFHSIATNAGLDLAGKAVSRKEHRNVKRWAQMAAELNPLSEDIQLRVISLLDKAGEPAAALETYNTYTELIKKEFEEEPGKELKALVEKIKTRRRHIPERAGSREQPGKDLYQFSIAVLPFETLGSEKASAFTDAIHGDILTRLSQVSDLFVISRTSVQSFRSTRKLLPDIARELNVGWILTGEVQEIDKHVKVSVRLVKSQEDRQVWAEIYQRKLTAGELFDIQAEITRKISESLKMQLTRKERTAIRQIPTEDLEAFRLHAYGRWNLDQRTEKAMRMAEKYFRQAISHDPNYAQAWMGLADALSLRHDYGHEKDGQNILSEARKAAHRALELDPEMAEAYASLGLYYTTIRDAKSAVYNLNKAVELRPGHAEAHAWLSWIFSLTGNPEEALENALKAVKVNPLSQEAISNLSLSWLINGEYTKSVHEAERLLQIQPDFTSAQFQEGLALYHLEMYREADKVLKDLLVPWAGNGPLATRILSCIRSGEYQKAERLSEGIKKDEFARGLIHATNGEPDLALEKFEKIERWNYWEMLSIYHLYPDLLDPVRENTRFQQILQTVNSNWGLTDHKELAKIKKKGTSETVPKPGKQQTGIESGSYNAIAILPFKDLDSPEPRFTDGIHGDILASLSRIKDLPVISRTSVCQYDRTGKKPGKIGEELQVSYLLEGEVKQTSEDIHLNLYLTKTANGSKVWKKNYHRKLSAENIFLIEEEVTKDLLEVLKVQLSGKEKKRVPRSSTTNLEAYRLYAQGRSCLGQRTETGIYQGLDCFQGSIELDPGYALAWSGLADAISLLQFYGFPIPRNSPDPIEAATRAVELHKNLSEAHTSLGIFYSINQQGSAALRELEIAVDLSPGYAEALIWLGWVNLVLGRPKKALEPAKRAVRLNPLSPAFRVFLSDIYLGNKLQKEALTEARRAREINPEYGLAHYMEGLVLYHTGNFEEAVFAFEKTLSIIPSRGTPNRSEVNTALAFTYHTLGNKNWGRELKNEIYGRIDPFPLAMLQTLFGQVDEAFKTFERVQDWSSFSTETIRYFFPEALSPLRKDKRYKDLITQVNKAWGLTEVESLL
ncbi:tetratricopeptide repeat protein [Salegentibacter sp. JZCK2]|uniref:tetratricopeptide repeat protein n=1 Tax=Salegentibacter tibetensis TaxID=2873600 RepID=UPI001CCC1052|nr:tetratricopeptide repeat protein [Salegentibacter tibetensis]MBZ9730035.1 tetratricopeptide repeat protein [Salegentibacter tibetensis]